MKTVIIYETSESTALHVMDGDLNRFNGIFVNDTESDETLANELIEIDLGDEITVSDVRNYIIDGAELIHCGFLY